MPAFVAAPGNRQRSFISPPQRLTCFFALHKDNDRSLPLPASASIMSSLPTAPPKVQTAPWIVLKFGGTSVSTRRTLGQHRGDRAAPGARAADAC